MQSDLEQKTLSFKPKINQSTKGWNYFNERLPALVEREKLKLQVLEEMRKENEENDMKECSFKPNINSNFKSKRKFSEQKRPKTSIYDKLYTTNKDKYEEIQKGNYIICRCFSYYLGCYKCRNFFVCFARHVYY